MLQGVEGKGLLCGLCKWEERFDVISFFFVVNKVERRLEIFVRTMRKIW